LLLTTTDQPPRAASTIRNLQSQDLFDFLKQCGCTTLEIPETGDDTVSVAMVHGSSDKADVEMDLEKGIRTKLLNYIRILECILEVGPTIQDKLSR